MIFSQTILKGSYVIEPTVSEDERGWFARIYCKKDFQEIGHNKEWVQMNHSSTKKKGSIRGMHFQLHPFKEIKLVKCVTGSVYDVIIDLRTGSPTYLKWFGQELSAENRKMLYIPEGFAHGFQTLTDDCGLIYLHSEYYVPNVEGGIRYNDPKLNIEWPLIPSVISDRDSSHPYVDENFKGI
jgi:dTDP-4-dehydrorhamnose 3,5-epimerase